MHHKLEKCKIFIYKRHYFQKHFCSLLLKLMDLQRICCHLSTWVPGCTLTAPLFAIINKNSFPKALLDSSFSLFLSKEFFRDAVRRTKVPSYDFSMDPSQMNGLSLIFLYCDDIMKSLIAYRLFLTACRNHNAMKSVQVAILLQK